MFEAVNCCNYTVPLPSPLHRQVAIGVTVILSTVSTPVHKKVSRELVPMVLHLTHSMSVGDQAYRCEAPPPGCKSEFKAGSHMGDQIF